MSAIINKLLLHRLSAQCNLVTSTSLEPCTSAFSRRGCRGPPSHRGRVDILTSPTLGAKVGVIQGILSCNVKDKRIQNEKIRLDPASVNCYLFFLFWSPAFIEAATLRIATSQPLRDAHGLFSVPHWTTLFYPPTSIFIVLIFHISSQPLTFKRFVRTRPLALFLPLPSSSVEFVFRLTPI